MPKFLELTDPNNEQITYVNADKIVRFWKSPNVDHTSIELDGAKTLGVREMPGTIRSMLLK